MVHIFDAGVNLGTNMPNYYGASSFYEMLSDNTNLYIKGWNTADSAYNTTMTFVRGSGTGATGNVGIGLTNPGTALEVNGTAKMTGFQLGTSTTAGWVLTANSSGVGTWAAPSGGTGGSNWTLDSTNGVLRPNNNTLDLLIGGTSTVSAKFAVLNMVGNGTPTASIAGTLSLGSAGGTTRTIGATAMNPLQLGDAKTGDLIFAPANSAAMTIKNGGNVGIGITNPGSTLTVAGTSNLGGTTVSNTGTLNVPSGQTYQLGGTNAIVYPTGTSYTWFFGSAGNTTATGQYNLGLGYAVLSSINDGTNNVGLGAGALNADVSGSNNMAIGSWSLYHTTSSNNIAIGTGASQADTTGGNNTAIGGSALTTNSAGWNNVAIGYEAGNTTSGGNNLYLGYEAGHYADASNELYVGDVKQASAANDKAYSLLYGQFSGAAGSLTGQQLTVNGTLNVNGSASLSANMYFKGASTAHTFNILDNGTLNFQRYPGGDRQTTVRYCSLAIMVMSVLA